MTCTYDRCILFCFYIKPQPWAVCLARRIVVSYSVSTSNHNWRYLHARGSTLYLILFLHQTTTFIRFIRFIVMLYLILFLHQTTTTTHRWMLYSCCILFCFYIKPQQSPNVIFFHNGCILFCFYIKPQPRATPRGRRERCILFCFYIKPQLASRMMRGLWVVSYSVSTSNHNSKFENQK